MPVFHQIFDLDRNTNALGVRQYACIDFVQSNEKSDFASDAQSLCGIALMLKFKEGRCRNTGVPQGHLHFYPNLKFGEMLAYFKPFRRRSSVFRQAENS